MVEFLEWAEIKTTLNWKKWIKIQSWNEIKTTALIQSNLDHPDLHYPDFPIIRTFFDGPNFHVWIIICYHCSALLEVGTGNHKSSSCSWLEIESSDLFDMEC